jgi:Tol biopolymer transport system component
MKRPATPAEHPEAKPFAPSRRFEGNAHHSRDGQRVTFASERSGSLEIWVCDSEGRTAPVKLTSFAPHATGTPRLSRDGREVAFDSRKSGRSAVWAVGVEDGRYRQLTTGQEDMTPSWSLDKRWVYFASERDGTPQIWKVSAQEGQQGRGEVRLTKKHGGFVPCESHDGKWVYYCTRTQSEPPAIWRVPAEGGEEERVLELPKDAIWQYLFGWTLVERGIYFLDRNAPPGPTVKFFDFASQQSTEIARLKKNPFEDIFSVAVSPDEQWILYAVRSNSRDIMLVENFR